MTSKSNSASSKKFTERVWEELKKINWREVNRDTSKPFTIGLIGSELSVTEIKNWLDSFPYDLFGMEINKENIKASKKNTSAKDKIVVFNNTKPIDEKLAKSMAFCIVDSSEMNIELKRLQVESYIYESPENSALISNILSNNDDLKFAISYSFPVFRTEAARDIIGATAFQNAVWAIGTAAPNFIPGPQQVVTIPLEAVSDFAVLTTNEVKMMFELLGIAGFKVNPFKALVEFITLVGIAKLAQMAATQVSGKVPAGVGIVAKGAIAYAFTFAIGEALYFYITTGEKAGSDFFNKIVPIYFEKGKDLVQEYYEQLKGNKKKD